MPPKNKILIYQDYVHNNGVLHRRLRETYGNDNVFSCDADDILNGILDETVFLFVMPGGADLYYCEKLNGAGNKAIREFVESGGNFLGVCAGAYYASDNIIWAENERQPIIGSRELKFFEGSAIGPIYRFLEDRDFSKSWQNIVDIRIEGEVYPALYYGGPFFLNAENGFGGYVDCPGEPAAIVKRRIGGGMAILAAPHIEYRPQDLAATIYANNNASVEWQGNLLQKFKSDYDPGHDIWDRVIREFA